MTLEERYEDEVLTDNTDLKKCEQCKDCMYRDDGTVYSNDYRKACCQIYSHPLFKPIGVINGNEECEVYEKA